MRSSLLEILRDPWNRVGLAVVAALVVLLIVVFAADYLG